MDNVLYISVDDICANLNQPRKYFDQNALEELAQSIKNYGIIQPITVRKLSDDKYEIIAGERRFRAARLAGLDEVPVILIDIDDKEAAEIALLENIQRENLNYIEEAEAYYNLINQYGYTQEKLAENVGKKQSTIANKLRLLKLDDSVRKDLLKNNLTERHARALLKLPNKKMQISVIKTVVSKGLNVKKTEEFIENKLHKIYNKENDIAVDGKKRIKGIFSSKIYINTIKQVFDKYGIKAKYKSKELEDTIEVTVVIPKK
ncbi:MULTISPECIES: nucleoid occlusion protein [Clostridium]|uniref:nucleoid occlusion protein n=1 Tax=Clostridium TaxID=1485 RepID=UPI0008255882|nr:MULTISPECIES: nucleoid occlusion protein [Clostridium]PJI08366.1 nucleoid occlusion protein [Clostridium sp. CT7]